MTIAEKILKKHKLRITPIRLDVINSFSQAGRALSSNDIEQSIVDVDRITLYRTLKSFEDKGVIHKALDGTSIQKYALCESNCTEDHHHDEHVHFHCLVCEDTVCLDHITLPNLTLPSGYSVKETNIIVNGTCQKCG